MICTYIYIYCLRWSVLGWLALGSGVWQPIVHLIAQIRPTLSHPCNDDAVLFGQVLRLMHAMPTQCEKSSCAPLFRSSSPKIVYILEKL